MDHLKRIAELEAKLAASEKRNRELTQELRTTRTTREDVTLLEAFRAAGVPASALKDAAHILRAESEIVFEDDGALSFADFGDRIYRDPIELAKAFVGKHPSFSREHHDAVAKDRGGATGPRDFANMNAVELAEIGFAASPPNISGLESRPVPKDEPSSNDRLATYLAKGAA